MTHGCRLSMVPRDPSQCPNTCNAGWVQQTLATVARGAGVRQVGHDRGLGVMMELCESVEVTAIIYEQR